MECLIACPNYPNCTCGDDDDEYYNDILNEEFLDQDEFDDWFTEEE